MKQSAIVFVPHGQQFNDRFNHRLRDHLRNRSYDFIALLRDWPLVDRMLHAGQANIVVMIDAEPAPPEVHAVGGDGDTMRLPVAPDEPTRDLGAQHRRAAANGRFVSGRLSRERIHEVRNGPREGLAPTENVPPAMVNEVAVYRSGYADGYLDCATLRDRGPEPR